MATLHISEAEAARDLHSLLDRVSAETRVLIERADGTCAVLSPIDPTATGFDLAFDAMLEAKIDAALNDSRPPVDSDVVEAYFARRRAAALASSSANAA